MEEKTFDDTVEEIIELLENRQYRSAREEILKNNGVDSAEILEEIIEELGIKIAIVVFRMLPKDVSVEVFSYLTIDDQKDIINGITDMELSYIIDELDFDDKIDVLEELPANIVDKILEKSTKAERKLINTFLNYPDDCAGSLMTPEYISLEGSMTVREALKHIKDEGMDSETVYTCYVKSEGRKLEGIVSLRTLVVSDDDTLISDLMHTDFVEVNVYDDQEEVSDAFMKYGFLAIPVVDNEGRLVGIVTVDDIMDVIEEEATEDIERMAGVLSDDDDREYLDISVWGHIRSRIMWLTLMMFTAMITGGILGAFEDMLTPTLVCYIPLLMGTSGNAGNQAATLVTRGIAVGDLDTDDALRVLWKEFRIGIGICLVLGSINFIKVLAIDRVDITTALIVNLSLVIIVIIAKMLGGLIPMAAKKLGIDPALVANPLLTSLSDMISVVTYFAIATAMLTNV